MQARKDEWQISDFLFQLPIEMRQAHEVMLAELAAVQNISRQVADQSALQPSAIQAARNQRWLRTSKVTDDMHKLCPPSKTTAMPAGMAAPARKQHCLSNQSGQANVDADDRCPAFPGRPAQGQPVTNIVFRVLHDHTAQRYMKRCCLSAWAAGACTENRSCISATEQEDLA